MGVRSISIMFCVRWQDGDFSKVDKKCITCVGPCPFPSERKS